MNGIIVVHKEAGMTSHDVVNQMRKILQTKKIGHTGTLDPQATGVLLILVGKACKALPYLEDTDKEYIATMEVGKRTLSDDIWGEVLETRAIQPIEQFPDILKTFEGKYQQLPPMVSSVRVNGKKLYEYARANEKVERPLREVEVYKIEALDDQKLKFRVACSSGTYIRSLCVDIAAKTNNLGCMSSLIRTSVGRFTIDDAFTLQEIEQGNYKLHSLIEMFDGYEQLEYEPIMDVMHGKRIHLTARNDRVMIVHNNEAIAVYERELATVFRCIRGLW